MLASKLIVISRYNQAITKGDVMKRSMGAIIIFTLCGLIFAVGCSSLQTEEANKLIDEANKHIEKGNLLEKEIEKSMDEMESFGDDTAGLKKSLKVTNEAMKKVDEQEKEGKAVMKNYKEIKKLKISEEFMKYVDMEIDAAEVDIESIKPMRQSLNEFVILFEKSIKGTVTEKDVEDFGNKAVKLADQGEVKVKEYEKLKDKADKYFKSEELGE